MTSRPPRDGSLHSDEGLTRVAYEETEPFRVTKGFLDDPNAFLRPARRLVKAAVSPGLSERASPVDPAGDEVADRFRRRAVFLGVDPAAVVEQLDRVLAQ